VIGGRGDQQQSSGSGKGERDEILHALKRAQVVKTGRQGCHEQKCEQHLDAGLNHTDLLQQLDQVAIEPLQVCLVSAVGASFGEQAPMARPRGACVGRLSRVRQ
jgi:hypothetical protein